MSIINNRIRRRREDRIKRITTMRLVEKETAAKQSSKPVTNAVQKWDDPEYVWKHGGGANSWTRTDDTFKPIQTRKKPPFYSRLKGAVVVSFLLFAVVWLLFQLPYPWAIKGQQWVEDVMTREFNYTETAEWYSRLFEGSPSLLPSFFDNESENPSKPAQGNRGKMFVPTTGSVIVPFNTSSPGVWIKGKEHEPVMALSEGWIIYAAESKESKYTVIIQHADNMQTVYSNLTDVRLKKNDWVGGGEQIGRMTQSEADGSYQLFFAVKKDENYLDPQDVVALD